jgi:hypothetical protein
MREKVGLLTKDGDVEPFYVCDSQTLILLTLSYPMWPLCGNLVLGIHISPINGPIEIILSRKLIYYVPPIHFACSIM